MPKWSGQDADLDSGPATYKRTHAEPGFSGATPQNVYVVLFRHEPGYKGGEAICQVKGTFSSVQKANQVALEIVKREFDNSSNIEDILEREKPSTHLWDIETEDDEQLCRAYGHHGETCLRIAKMGHRIRGRVEADS